MLWCCLIWWSASSTIFWRSWVLKRIMGACILSCFWCCWKVWDCRIRYWCSSKKFVSGSMRLLLIYFCMDFFERLVWLCWWKWSCLNICWVGCFFVLVGFWKVNVVWLRSSWSGFFIIWRLIFNTWKKVWILLKTLFFIMILMNMRFGRLLRWLCERMFLLNVILEWLLLLVFVVWSSFFGFGKVLDFLDVVFFCGGFWV